MPLTAPTYSAAYSQSEQNANAVILTGFASGTNAALLAWFNAVERALEVGISDHGDPGGSPSALQNPMVGNLQRAYAAVVAALT